MTDDPSVRPLKICHIVATTEGAVWAFEQLRDLRDHHGCDVSAILNGEKGALVDRFRAAGIPVQVADFDFVTNLGQLRLWRRVIDLVRLLRRERFDVIQTHLFHSMVVGRIAAWIAGVPVRFSMIAGPIQLEAYGTRWIDRLTCWADTTIIASCEYTRTLYRRLGVAKGRLTLIYYGPDDRKFDPAAIAPADLRGEFGWAPDTPLIGMVAYFYAALPHNRWIPPAVQGRSVKSQEDLIRAVPLVLTEFPRAKFLLVGSGWGEAGQAYLERMQRLVAELGLERSIVFAGFRTDVPAVLRALNVSVQCSLSENLGGTIESLLMQRPTVATRVGGMIDAVLDGKTGVLVNPADPVDLARGIIDLLRDPVTARQYGIAGRERMLANFTLHRTVDDLAELYERKARVRRADLGRHLFPFRLAAGYALCLLIEIRYRLVDAHLLLRWDEGWRPWRLSAPLILVPRRSRDRLYAFVGRHVPGYGPGRRVRSLISVTMRAVRRR